MFCTINMEFYWVQTLQIIRNSAEYGPSKIGMGGPNSGDFDGIQIPLSGSVYKVTSVNKMLQVSIPAEEFLFLEDVEIDLLVLG